MRPLLLSLLLFATPAYADDLTVLGCSPWLKDGETCHVNSWGGNWDAGTVSRLAVQHRIFGRVDHCYSMCVEVIDRAPQAFCLEPYASIGVHLERQYAGKWVSGTWYEDRPRRVTTTKEPDLSPVLKAYVTSQGGYRQVSFDEHGSTDWIEIPRDVALKVWRPC